MASLPEINVNTNNEEMSQQRGPRRSFTADVVTLVTGTTIAQIISILSAPLITRLYGADAFGLSALFSSLLGIIAMIVCLSYEVSIMIPKTDGEAANILALSIVITSLTSLSLIPLFGLWGDTLLSLFNANKLSPYLWLIPPTAFLSGLFSTFTYWNSRVKRFMRISIAQMSKVASTTGTQLGAGFAGYATGGSLIGASVIGQFVATSTLGYQTWRSDNELFIKKISWKVMREVSKTYRDYPKYGLFTSLINNFSLQIPIFILSAFFTTTVVGYYSLGLMVLQMPMVVIGGAIAQVFFQRAAEAYNLSRSAFTSIVETTVGRLILLGILPILLISFLGRDLFVLVFGSGWAEAGVYAQILSFWILVQFIASPLTALFNVQGYLRANLLFQIIMCITRIIAMIVGGIYGDLYLTLMLLSVSGVLFYSFESVWLIKKAWVSFISVLKNISKSLLLAILIIISVVIIKYIIQYDMILVIAIGILGMTIYYYIIFIRGNMKNLFKV